MSDLSHVLVPSANQLGECPAYIHGDVKNSTTAIIVIQEWWGVNDYIKDTARQIGEDTKCVTLVPDLYRGKVGTDMESAGHLASGLDWMGAIEDIDGCARYLKAQGIHKVGVTGFCMGGALCIGIAALRSNIDAAVQFYGIPKKENLPYEEKNIRIPLQCHYGEDDAIVGVSSPADYEALSKRLTEAKVNFELHAYAKSGHAFANPTSPWHNSEARKLSFSRMYDFFAKHLAPDQ